MRENPYTIEEVTESYIAEADNTFSLNKIAKAVKNKVRNIPLPEIKKEIREIIRDHLLLFPDEAKTDSFVPRSAFFNKSSFCITPSAFEINNGILIPGHRFVPFASEDVFPSDIILIPDKKKKPVKTKVIACPIKDVAIYHTLLGSEEMFNYFVSDHRKNVEIIKNGDPDAEIELTVFDFKRVYEKYCIKEGDALIFKIKDWKKGVFNYDFIPEEVRDDKKKLSRIKWCEIFEKSLKEVIETYGNYISIPEQLAQTYFRAGKKLLSNPAASIDEFKDRSETIELRMFGNHCVLWNIENELDISNTEIPEGVMISKGKTGSLEEIFKDIKLPLKISELEGFMLNELFNGGNSIEAVFDRYLAPWKPQYKDDAQEAVMLNFIDEIWENISLTYNRFHDEYKGIIREAVLKIIETRLDWLNALRNYDFDEKKVPKKNLRLLAELSERLNIILAKANSEEPFTPNGDEMDQIMASIEDVANSQEKLITGINDKISL